MALTTATVRGAPLRDTFQELSDAPLPHLDNEEAVLFPTLMQARPDRAVVRDELAAMYQDHLAVGQLLAGMSELSDDFAVPEGGCNTYRVYMAELAAPQDDILRHVHLENHALMPRSVANAPSIADRFPKIAR